jgi:hypothetical protein
MREFGFGLPLSFLLALQISDLSPEARSGVTPDVTLASVDGVPDSLAKQGSQGADAQSRTQVAQYTCFNGFWRRC